MIQKEKYQFDVDFQQEILQFTVTDPKLGNKALELFESEYFTLIPHSIIAEALKRHYKKRFIIPSIAVLKEELRQMFRRKQWQSLLIEGDKEKVFKIVKKIYSKPVKDPAEIYDKTRLFARFTALKAELENVDLNNFDSYNQFHGNIHKAIHIGTELNQRKSMLLLRDAKSRAVRRLDNPPGLPTPFWQLNNATNSGGTTKGNIIFMLSEAKFFKTGFLLNTARGNMKAGRVTLYADFENGEEALGLRADQSMMNMDRSTILTPEVMDKFLKMVRQYRRFGGELAIIRLPAFSTAADIGKEIDRLWDEEGLKVQELICDYPDIMADSKGNTIEDKRVSQVILDLKNLAEEKDLDRVWCPSHVNREASKMNNNKKAYKQTDMAKSLDKIRHADMVWSMVQSEEEREAGIIRVELTAQRDGIQPGSKGSRMWFWVDMARQRLKEFNKAQVQAMEEEMHNKEGKSEADDKSHLKNKKTVSDV